MEGLGGGHEGGEVALPLPLPLSLSLGLGLDLGLGIGSGGGSGGLRSLRDLGDLGGLVGLGGLGLGGEVSAGRERGFEPRGGGFRFGGFGRSRFLNWMSSMWVRSELNG